MDIVCIRNAGIPRFLQRDGVFLLQVLVLTGEVENLQEGRVTQSYSFLFRPRKMHVSIG